MSPAGLPDAPGGHPVSSNDAAAYRRFCRWASWTVVVGAGTLLPMESSWRALCAVAVLPLLAITAAATLRFPAQWPAQRNWRSPALWLGLAFMAGGTAFDIAATMRHSPDLAMEANPVAVALLDHGVPAARVKLLGLAAQAILLVAASMLWINFCARRAWYLRRLDALGDGSLSLHLLGQGQASVAGVLLGRGTDLAVLVSTLGALVPGAFAYRWYLGLEWFGWVPVSRGWAPVGCVALAWLALYAWASYRLTPPPPATDA